MNIKVEQIELSGNRMIVKQDKPSDIVSAGGLVVNAASTMEQQVIPTGIVVSVGDAVTKYSVGDRIFFGGYAGAIIPVNATENNVYLLMSEPEPIGKIKN